jgi:adenosylcobyric acid synthase
MKYKSLMIQGTGSSVGKSIITAGLCRVLKNRGMKPAPFKSQNMALNSYITEEGHEMGRAQVVQAEAAGLKPSVLMNPILLKPSTDQKAQVIVMGKVLENMSASDYHAYKPELKQLVKKTFETLAAQYDCVIIEGAGSPAEINLREGDLVNMGMAELSDSPVLLVGDIDKGGVFASLYGTVMLLEPEERQRIKGFIINKFRGDIKLLEPGLKQIEDLTGIPVLGVLPYTDLNIEDEDSVTERFVGRKHSDKPVRVEVLYLPHVSNFTDFNAFELQPDVSLRYVMRGENLDHPDLIILPGSKNTIEDLIYLKNSGLSEQILRAHRSGTAIVGICGGYQMLGKTIEDPHATESAVPSVNGLGLLDVQTVFEMQKMTTQATGRIETLSGSLKALSDVRVEGYEIHMGVTERGADTNPFMSLVRLDEADHVIADGAISSDERVFGTYLHGVFDSADFMRGFIDSIRLRKGIGLGDHVAVQDFKAFKETQYDALADLLEKHLDMTALLAILEGQSC